jgi:tetratricopeptide (TPR) repeat protein
MSEPHSRNTQESEPTFKLNYATVILLMVILIPVVYTVITNLQPKPASPEINAAPKSAPVSSAAAASPLEPALKAVVDNPGFQSYLNLGLVYYGAAKYDESIKAWEKALEYNPKSDLAYNNIAAAYGAINKWDEEIAACQKALAINPNLDLAKRNLSWAQEMKNKK